MRDIEVVAARTANERHEIQIADRVIDRVMARNCTHCRNARYLPVDASVTSGASENGLPGYFGGAIILRIFCISLTLIFMPPGMIMSPGVWSALHGPAHFAAIVMLVSAGMPAGPPVL